MIKAGFSRVDVTPPLGTNLQGYPRDRFASKVLEPIELNAIAISNGENTILLIAADFLGITLEYSRPIRQQISERTGLPYEAITVSALHQHTSIGLRRNERVKDILKDQAYMDLLYRKFGDVAVMALDDMDDAVVSVGTKQTAEQIAFIRRYFLKNGTLKTNPFNFESEIDRPAEEPDNNVRLIKFKRENKKDIAFVNFQTHPDVAAVEMFTFDWPGFVRTFVEKDNPDTHCIFFTGFQGDSNHLDFVGGIRRGYEHAVHMGRVIADTVKEMWNETEEKDIPFISSNLETVYNQTRTDGFEHLEECQRVLREHYGDMSAKTESGISYNEAARIANMVNTAPLFQKITVTIVELGDIVFYGLSGEPFTNYANNVRKKYPDKFVISACCTNGYEGYLPTTIAFEQGGYEAATSPFTPTIEEDCLKAVDKILNRNK